jgi:hypothetical protein
VCHDCDRGKSTRVAGRVRARVRAITGGKRAARCVQARDSPLILAIVRRAGDFAADARGGAPRRGPIPGAHLMIQMIGWEHRRRAAGPRRPARRAGRGEETRRGPRWKRAGNSSSVPHGAEEERLRRGERRREGGITGLRDTRMRWRHAGNHRRGLRGRGSRGSRRARAGTSGGGHRARPPRCLVPRHVRPLQRLLTVARCLSTPLDPSRVAVVAQALRPSRADATTRVGKGDPFAPSPSRRDARPSRGPSRLRTGGMRETTR